MSLDWDLSKIEDRDTVCRVTDADGNKVMSPATHALIWSTMAVGLGQITEKNAEVFYARVSYWEALRNIPQDERITPTDVQAHIGLRTNVSDETDRQWLLRIWLRWREDKRSHYRRVTTAAPVATSTT